jgi:hypothetical protein
MKVLYKLFVLLLASIGLASCGGGGGGSNSAFGPPGNDTTLSLSATATTLPLCEPGASAPSCLFFGSPFISEVTVTWRHKDGQLVAGTSPVTVSVTPTNIITFSTLNKGPPPAPPLLDQFHTLLGSGPVDVTAGVGTIFVHSDNVPGTGVLSVTAIDPVSNHTITAQMTITVAGAATGVPSSVIASTNSGVYISGSNGPQSTILTAFVFDGSNASVANPNGFNNVQFDIVGPANSDARLSGTSGNGTSVKTQTHNGVATVTFQSGTQQGPVQIKASADRADNNVDNGISDPVSATMTVVVSDGKLYSLQLTSPGTLAPSILENPVSVLSSLDNGTYSFVVSAIGQDRQGNPVLPGTQIAFGSIDTPVDSNGAYLLSGTHGDPQEGGTLFTATDGHFTTAGGGAGPGDTLLVIGKLEQGAPAGNDDLESAAKVASVQSATTLHVASYTPFNLNDTTGVSVNNGPVLPYIIGRALIGNITSPAFTDDVGVATTILNYPTSKLGHVTAVWAQGNGTDTVTGGPKLVTDINLLAFPGIAPATITVSPNPIPGNITTEVDACIFDALGNPLQGVVFHFGFANLGVGSGTLDGIGGAGTVPQATGTDGCVATTVTTTGIAGTSGGGTAPNLTFTAGTATSGPIPIVAGGSLVLLARPSTFIGDGGTVTLTLLSGNGTPVPGVQLTGTCTGDPSVGISNGPGVTNAQGQTTATISADLNKPNSPGTGTCTFTTSAGAPPSAVVTLQGIDTCKSGVSPLPPGCTSTPGTPSTVTLNIISGATTASFTSSPPGASCSGIVGSTQTCTASLNGGSYTITASAATGSWSGSCTPVGGTNPKASATLLVPTAATAGLTCTLTMP